MQRLLMLVLAIAFPLHLAAADPAEDAQALESQAASLYRQGRYGDAEPLYSRVLALLEQTRGADDADVARVLYRLASVYDRQGRYAQAEPLHKRVLAIADNTAGFDQVELSRVLNQLGNGYREQGRFGEAELPLKRALAIRERALGPDHLDVAESLNNLGGVYLVQARYREAELLFRRSLEIKENGAGGKPTEATAATLNNLAFAVRRQGRAQEAEPLAQRAVQISEAALGPDHPTTAGHISNLAVTYIEQGKLAQAEPLMWRGLALREKAHGPDHPDVASSLTDVGLLLYRQNRLPEAEAVLQRALAIRQKTLGQNNPFIAQTQNGLSEVYHRMGKIDRAADASRAAVEILTRYLSIEAGLRSTAMVADQRGYRRFFLNFIPLAIQQSIDEAKLSDPAAGVRLRRAAIADTFRVAQMTQVSTASAAVASTAARAASGSDSRAALIRERQDAAARWQQLDDAVVKASSRPAAERRPGEDAELRSALDETSARLDMLDAAIVKAFPAYAEFSNPQPLSAAAARDLLAPDEALLVYVTGADGIYLWVVRHESLTFHFAQTAENALTAEVATLRERLDPELNPNFAPFPAAKAYSLYQRLVGPVENQLKGAHHLLMVLDGPLQSLPFGVLPTKPPAREPGKPADHRAIAWLARDYAITVLPSVSSLRALRQFNDAKRGTLSFLGVGNPVLTGDLAGSRGVRLASLFRGGGVDVDRVRELAPLPDTADELRKIAASLGATEGDLLLGERASEPELRQTPLDRYRAIAFATHGLMSGELSGLAEPALVLTPPPVATPGNDGLLTASKIAALKLNADWVVLSACNTAAGDGTPDGSGLSGLARAFFYAGARSLLVSHWPVWSEATVALTTDTFAALAKDPRIGRAEALRRAEMAMLDPARPAEFAHPLAWAPFVVVGEGGAGR